MIVESWKVEVVVFPVLVFYQSVILLDIFNIYFIYLAVPVLSCGTWDLHGGMWDPVPQTGTKNLGRLLPPTPQPPPCTGSSEFHPLGHQGSPLK